MARPPSAAMSRDRSWRARSGEVLPALDWLSIAVALPVLVLVVMGIRAHITTPWDGLEWLGSSFVVVRVAPGGPAEAAGVRLDDVVLCIDGVPPDQKIPLYSGGPGSPMHLSLLRDGETIDLTVTLRSQLPGALVLKLTNLATALLFSVLSLAFTVGERRSRSGVTFTLFYQLLAAVIACGSVSGYHYDWAIRGFQASLALLSPATIFMASSFPLFRNGAVVRFIRAVSAVAAAVLLLPVIVLPGHDLLGSGLGYLAYQISLPILLLSVVTSLVIITQSFRRTLDAGARAATRISLLGLIISVLPVVGLYLVPRLVLGRGIVSAEVTILFLIFLPLYHGFSLTRRRFWGLESVLPPISSAVLSSAFFVSALLGAVWFVKAIWPTGGEAALVSGMVLGAVVLAAANVPVISGSRRLVHNAFYGQAYDYQSIVSEMSRDLAQAVGHDELGALVVGTLCNRMNLAGSALLGNRADDGTLCLEASRGGLASALEGGGRLPVDGALASMLVRYGQPLTREGLQMRLSTGALTPLERRLLEDDRVALWAPVMVKGILRGLVILGQKRKDALFSREDLEIFSTLAGQIGVSMENADLYDHLRAEMRKLQEMQDQLVQAEKLSAVGELVSGVAHELNNPLTAVIGYAELLRADSTNEQALEDLDNILRSAERSRHIVRNLLTFARRQKSERRMVSINDIIRQTVEIQAYQLRVDNVTVETELDPNLPFTAVDNSQMQQVFLNIIMNAHQAIRSVRDRGIIRISTGVPRPGIIRATIADDGPGIGPDVAGRIFDPFFTTKEVGVGTGLGLSICYGIVSSHGGRIWVESIPGAGATFLIEVPVQAEPLAVEVPEAPLTEVAAGTRVLAVEDEAAVAAVLNRLLTKMGCLVDVVSGGLAALDRLRANRYDVIISDLRMPGLSGPALWERMKNEHPDQAGRVVFVTGDTASPETEDFLRMAGQPVLPKPFGAEDLAKALSAVRALNQAGES